MTRRTHPGSASRRRFIAAAGAASLALAAPGDRARARHARRSRSRSAASRGPPATRRSPQYMMAQQDVREVRRRRRLRPHGRLSRLSVGAADGRGVRVGQPRLRHVGQHADRAPDRAEPADPARHRRRRPFPLRARDAQGFADPQHRRPEGQDRRRAARRRSRTTCCRRCCASSSAIADPKAHGITVVNTPTQAQAATIPTGMDAAVLIYPGVPQGATPSSAPSAS